LYSLFTLDPRPGTLWPTVLDFAGHLALCPSRGHNQDPDRAIVAQAETANFPHQDLSCHPPPFLRFFLGGRGNIINCDERPAGAEAN
jgi:hypothetical protein